MRFEFNGVEFGGRAEPLIVTRFEPGSHEVRGGDQPAPGRDGSIPVEDYLGGATWAFDISTNREDLAGARASGAALEAAWKDPAVRLNSTVKVPLTYDIDGQRRRVYGRPGQFAGVAADLLATLGVGKITADFRVLDPLHYDDDETSVVLTVVPATTGGLQAPLAAPLSTVRSSAPRAGMVTNTGDAATPLKVRFQGPITNPWVRSAAGLEVGITGTLAYDQTVTVDPLAGTVTRQDGTPAAGLLTRKTQLTGTLLQPGPTELSFGGTDPTGTAKATLFWRNAHTSI